MNKILTLLCVAVSLTFAQAQTNSDGLMMPKKIFCGGFLYGNDQWKNYWEGSLKRDNGNIGTLTTRSLMFMGTYGLSNRVNLHVMLPYVWAKATGGTLHEMEGLQDLTIGYKHRAFRVESETGVLNIFDAISFSTPVSSYTPDYYPLSLGTASTRLSYRGTINYAMKNGVYVNASAAYTWRSNVTLDRPAYFTGTSLYFTDEVHMPNVFDWIVDLGYHKGPLQTELFFTRMNTLGGTDIRRQDMPFVSNRMNASKVGALVMYYLPWPKNFAARASANYVVDGRNVGQSTAWSAGLLYTIYFTKK